MKYYFIKAAVLFSFYIYGQNQDMSVDGFAAIVGENIILKSDVFNEAVANLKAEYIQKWENSSEADTGFREDLHKAIRILPEVERHLRIIIEKGKITKAQIEKLRVLNRAIKP